MLTWFDPHLPHLALARSPGSRAPSLSQDLDVIEQAGIHRVVCLQEEFELKMNGEFMAQRRRHIEVRGMLFTHEAIEDFTAPSLSQALKLVKLIEQDFGAGRSVLIHCQAGLGRAGTIAACLLNHAGMSAADAIATTRFYRMGAIQSEEQERFIEEFSAHTTQQENIP